MRSRSTVPGALPRYDHAHRFNVFFGTLSLSSVLIHCMLWEPISERKDFSNHILEIGWIKYEAGFTHNLKTLEFEIFIKIGNCCLSLGFSLPQIFLSIGI